MSRSPLLNLSLIARSSRRLFLGLTIVSSLCLCQTAPEKLLQEAAYREDVEGDLEGAERLYVQILDGPSRNDSLLICTHLRLASCYEKKGDVRSLEIYRTVMRRFPKYSDAVRTARARLAVLSARMPDYTAMIDYYLARVALEPLGAISPDETMEAHTDWETGNLVVKNRKTGRITQLTHKTWSESPEFAYYKVWAPDGKKIAYGWYRESWYVDLRTVSVEGGEPEVVQGRSGWMIFPSDWSRDGKRILARVATREHSVLQDAMMLVAINAASGECDSLTILDGNSRGLRFSPDGRYAVFDLGKGEEHLRQVYTFSIADRTLSSVTESIGGDKDTPLWSPGGRHILFRVAAGRDAHLMAITMRDGGPAGSPFVLLMDLEAEIQRRAGIERKELAAAVQEIVQESALADKPAESSFDDDFSASKLDSGWKVVQWQGPNEYGFHTFGRISLIDNPGHLRYSLDPISYWSSLPQFAMFRDGDGYWYYPALQLRRKLDGTSWMLEIKARYSIVRPADSRYLWISVTFARNGAPTASATFMRSRSWGNRPSFSIQFSNLVEEEATRAPSYIPPGDTTEPLPYTAYTRFIRNESRLTVEMSEDGVAYIPVRSGTLPKEALASDQQLVISGGGWFTPAGSYVDFDYIRFKPLAAK